MPSAVGPSSFDGSASKNRIRFENELPLITLAGDGNSPMEILKKAWES